jgi:branched-chain amino acid transport system permease protein
VNHLLQTVVDGVAVGSLYALIALGYTMVYGILKFINFAHSDVFMFGAWMSYMLAVWAGWQIGAPSWAGILVLLGSMVLCGALGFTIERLAYRPLRSAPRINVLITAIGVSLLLENTGQLSFVFGTQPQKMPALLPDAELFDIAGVKIRLIKVLCVTIAFVLMILLERLVFGTKLGRAMRAVSYDTKTAALMGIDVDFVVSITFVIGSMLAAAAGFLNAQMYEQVKQSADTVWVLLGLKAFVAAVVGGIGNIRGAMAGGLLIGLIENFGSAYFSPNLASVYVFTVLILVLLLRPEGLLGKATVEKV